MKVSLFLALFFPMLAFAQTADRVVERRSVNPPAGSLCYCEAVKDRNIYEKDAVHLRLYNTMGRIVVLRSWSFEGVSHQKKTLEECDKARVEVPFCQWTPKDEN